MRSGFKLLLLMFLTATAGLCQQVNPLTGIRWSVAGGCTNPVNVYSPASEACIANGGASFGWVNTTNGSQSSGATTLGLTGSTSGYPLTGAIILDSEWEFYTGISGNVLTGITRGYHNTTAAAHSSSVNVLAVNVDFGVVSQPPSGGVFGFQNIGGGNAQILSVNCGFPGLFNYGGPIGVLEVNCGSSTTVVDSAGSIHQAGLNAAPNYLGPVYIDGVHALSPSGGVGLPIPIVDTTLLAQTNAPQQFGSPVGFTAPIYGPIISVPVPAIGAPSASGEFGGSCNITYDIVGVDADGNAVAGTPTAVTGILEFIPGTQGLINLQTPQAAGVVTYTPYRTSVSAGCGTATVGKGWAASSTSQYPLFQDTGGAGDSSSPPSAASVAKSCIGTVATPELFCQLAGAAPPSGSCTNGWWFHNTAGASSTTHLYICESGTWTGVL